MPFSETGFRPDEQQTNPSPLEYKEGAGINYTELNREAAPSPSNLEKALGKMEKLWDRLFKEIKIEGRENLEDLPSNCIKILAVSHLSDVDMHLTLTKLAQDFGFKIKFTHAEDVFENPAWVAGFKILGLKKEDIGIPLSVRHAKHKTRSGHVGQLDPKDYEPEKQSLDEGYVVAMAAHLPEYGGHLPKHPGLSTPYLAEAAAQSSDRPVYIIPVGVSIQGEKTVATVPQIISQGLKFKNSRPKAAIRIGKPMPVERTTTDLSKSGNATIKALKPLGEKIMQQIASLVDEDKRGVWATPQAP